MKGRGLYDLLGFVDLSDNNGPGEENGWDGYHPRKKPKRVRQRETGQATDQKMKITNNVTMIKTKQVMQLRKQIKTYFIDIYVSKIFKCFHLYFAHLCVKVLYGDFYYRHQTVGRPIKTDIR